MTLKEQTKEKIEDSKKMILQMIPTRTSDLIDDTNYNYGYLDSNLILHLLNINITLSSSQTIINSGSTMTINALVTDSDGNTVSNVPVQFYVNGTASGNPINTNSNGIAAYTYTGTGIGKTKISAKVGNLVSETLNVFDCPVYDGDNTPTSISWSKTNNAVVTDEVVSLIASVLNTNNNPCINIPVVFKQGDTVLGTAYTDVYGDATITYTWADSDIFNVTAQVGQSLSEDLTMFVKDNANLLSFNQWSATEYANNLNGFTSFGNPSIIAPSNNYSVIGNQCIYCARDSSHWWFSILLDTLPDSGNYTFSCNVYSNKGVTVRFMDPNAGVILSVDTSAGETTVSVSGLFEDISDNRIMFLLYGDDAEAYIDNLQLTPQ